MTNLNLSWLNLRSSESLKSSPRAVRSLRCWLLASLLACTAFCAPTLSLLPSLAMLKASTPGLWKWYLVRIFSLGSSR